MVKRALATVDDTRTKNAPRETDAERKLWLLLRDRRLAGVKFRRQAPVGPFIADFLCARRKLIVEADGGQHVASQRDMERDRWLVMQGYYVVRYSNFDILKNPNGVIADLMARLRGRPEIFGGSPLTRSRLAWLAATTLSPRGERVKQRPRLGTPSARHCYNNTQARKCRCSSVCRPTAGCPKNSA